jgi:predicted DNA-binding transcriptional regulator AlpA
MVIDTDKVICLTEIAEIAGVSVSAVSNWRRRHNDFPQAHVSMRLGDLWLREDVEHWLATRHANVELQRRRAIEYHARRLRELGA